MHVYKKGLSKFITYIFDIRLALKVKVGKEARMAGV